MPNEAITSATAARRRVGLRQPRHELPWVRPCDLPALLNISATSAWRLRQLDGFPAMNALGRYNAANVLAFVATLDRHALRDAKRAAEERCEGATDTTSIECRGVKNEGGGGIPPAIPNLAEPAA